MGSAANVLLVGVGGTGTKIVRNMLESWDRDGGHPRHIAVAIIDAHDGPPEGGTRPDWVYSGSSRIDFQRVYADHASKPASGLKNWWPSRVQVNPVVGFHHGCGATRANGRFFAFHYAERIQRTITQAMNRLSSARHLRDAAPTEAVNWEAYICCSAGNGTGAGNLLPMAALVRHALLERGATGPRVHAVIVPASVTKGGQSGMLSAHVAAAGVASLLELQFEANRKSQSLARPDRPYIHRGNIGGNYEDFRPYRDCPDNSPAALAALPYDSVYILDQFNSAGVKHEYPEIITAGAEALRALLGGTDQDNRLMDLEVRAGTEGRNFGSMGVMAFSAPTDKLATWCTGKQVQAALGDARRTTFDLGRAADVDLLVERVGSDALDLGRVKKPDEAVAASVEFFVDHVIRAREAGANDLFDRFKESFDQLSATFKAKLAKARDTVDVKERVVAYGEVSGAFDATRQEVAKFEAMLVRDFESLPDPEVIRYAQGRDGAGAKWLIEARALSFLEQGKPGLGATWFRALLKCLDAQKASVEAGEFRSELGGRMDDDHTGAAQQLLEQLEREASSFFAFLKKGSLESTGAEFESKAQRAFKAIVWQAKVKAVFAHFDRLRAHASLMEKMLAGVADSLQNPDVRAPADRTVERAELALRKSGAGDKRKELGLKDEVRNRMLAGLNTTGAATSVDVIAAGVADAWFDLAAAVVNEAEYASVSLLARRRGGNWPGTGRDSWAIAVTEAILRGPDTSQRLEDLVRAAVRREGNVEELLLAEGRELLEGYYRLVVKDGGRRTPEAEEARRTFEMVVPMKLQGDIENELAMIEEGRSFEEALLRPDLHGDGKQGALVVYLKARLLGMMGAARPLWRPNASTDELKLVQRMSFFTFARSMRLVGQVANSLKEQEAVKVQDSDDYPTDRIECTSVELGGKVEWILSETDIEVYRKAMKNMPDAPPDESQYLMYQGFNPHSERQYEEMGKRWLELRDEKVAGSAGSGGAEVLVGLGSMNVPGAKLLGFIEQRGQNFYLARAIEQVWGSDGRPLLDAATTLPAGAHIGPAGIVDFVAWLEGKSRGRANGETGLLFAATFREILWRDLEAWLNGDAEQDRPPTSLDDVCKVISAEAGRLRAERGEDARSTRIRAIGEATSALADALRLHRGARPMALAK
jgi:hypothetical protein